MARGRPTARAAPARRRRRGHLDATCRPCAGEEPLLAHAVRQPDRQLAEVPPPGRAAAGRSVGAGSVGDEWEITCADNGIGIEPEFADKVFVIFQRLHAEDAYPGTGIGLAIAKKIVEYHGGTIWVDPDAADGTTIRFTLPVAVDRRSPRSNRAAEHDAEHEGAGRMTATTRTVAPIEVLLVEDDPGDVLMTREAFEEHKVAQPAHRGLRRRRGAGLPAPRGRVRRRAARPT